ncbi:cysteine desulfurase family protein [Rhizorhapis sp. SPR117]|uniref:cysteine desulfurase family protein n=1 Tax=Rhizorhapis sp. SPR117 TaxID=2912611 RepID=UPI001F389D7F|nr:aminotransferase class V-fold PLP-dependent enzyme [Rhizorhapis sp. SPR117]
MSHFLLAERLYLDHAATTPALAEAREAMLRALWPNPSSPHADGRAARAALEEARSRIAAALGWKDHVIFTSGASEAIAIGLGRTKAARITTSPVEHDAVLRATKEAERLEVGADGIVRLPIRGCAEGTLFAIQHVNNETGVIQPLEELGAAIHVQGGVLFADCAQSAGKLPLPDADMIAISAHKFGGPPGIGALLIRDLTLIHPSGGQEQGYRAGTENLPGIMAMAAALDCKPDWLDQAGSLRAFLDREIEAAGGEVVAKDSLRSPAIASYRMPGVAASAQLIQFDMAGISVSAGSACSSGTIKASHVLTAMGWDAKAAGEVVRVSFGPTTSQADVERFLSVWTAIFERARR